MYAVIINIQAPKKVGLYCGLQACFWCSRANITWKRNGWTWGKKRNKSIKWYQNQRLFPGKWLIQLFREIWCLWNHSTYVLRKYIYSFYFWVAYALHVMPRASSCLLKNVIRLAVFNLKRNGWNHAVRQRNPKENGTYDSVGFKSPSKDTVERFILPRGIDVGRGKEVVLAPFSWSVK